MAHVHKGYLVESPEWWKHLRWCKRVFWKRHRKAEQRAIKNELRSRGSNGQAPDFYSGQSGFESCRERQ